MSTYKDDIHFRLLGKSYLRPIFSSALNIPEALKDYDSNLFLVLNTKRNVFEVHSLANIGDTYCMTIPLNELDERVLTLVRKNNVKIRGVKVFQEIDRHNEWLAEQAAKQRSDYIKYELAERLKPAVSRLAWEGA
jgi:hypothetical protein